MRDLIVQNALSYEGTRWKHQGRTPHVGLDCAGVLVCAYKEAGLCVEDDPNYSVNPEPNRMGKMLQKNAKRINFNERLPGDFVWLRFSDPQHLALLCNDDWIVHAYLQVKKVVVQRWDSQMQSRLVATFRHRSLDEQ